MTAVRDSNVMEKQLFSFISEILVILRIGRTTQLINSLYFILTCRKYRSQRQNAGKNHNIMLLLITFCSYKV